MITFAHKNRKPNLVSLTEAFRLDTTELIQTSQRIEIEIERLKVSQMLLKGITNDLPIILKLVSIELAQEVRENYVLSVRADILMGELSRKFEIVIELDGVKIKGAGVFTYNFKNFNFLIENAELKISPHPN